MCVQLMLLMQLMRPVRPKCPMHTAPCNPNCTPCAPCSPCKPCTPSLVPCRFSLSGWRSSMRQSCRCGWEGRGKAEGHSCDSRCSFACFHLFGSLRCPHAVHTRSRLSVRALLSVCVRSRVGCRCSTGRVFHCSSFLPVQHFPIYDAASYSFATCFTRLACPLLALGQTVPCIVPHMACRL